MKCCQALYVQANDANIAKIKVNEITKNFQILMSSIIFFWTFIIISLVSKTGMDAFSKTKLSAQRSKILLDWNVYLHIVAVRF